MDLRRLRLFLAVVDDGGMTRAAEAEHVSQPSVSQAIRELEAELGTPLFHRVGRRVVLTAAGEALVEPARQVLRDVETGRAAVEAVAGLAAGRLDLVALPTLAVDPVAPLVGAFRLAHPGVDIALADPADAAELVDLVASGESRARHHRRAGRRSRPHQPRARRTRTCSRCSRPGRTRRTPWRSRTLARFPLVTAPPGTTTRTQLEEAFAEAGVTPRIAVVTAQREAILPLVLAGAGATLFPRPLAEQAAALGARRGRRCAPASPARCTSSTAPGRSPPPAARVPASLARR